jgi:hypothetical protein
MTWSFPMADQTGPRGKLLRGARRIAQVIYPELYIADDKAAIRKLYVEQGRYPVFQLGRGDTELLALEDRLLSFLESHSRAAEAKAELAVSEAVAPPPSKTALSPKAASVRKAAPPRTRRRRRAA